jgi:L-aspartate oxidase
MTSFVEHDCDLLIIGSGAAGLSLALKMAEHCKIIVLSKSSMSEGSTQYAQGGIAAVFDESDSIDAHVADTLDAGAGLCDEAIVRMTASRAQASMKWLMSEGVAFDQEALQDGSTRLHLTREGGHSHRRILHAADATGQAVQQTLNQQVYAHHNILMLEGYNAMDLILSQQQARHCLGAWVWNRTTEKVERIRARFITLATGGASKVYQYTSNPDVSSGDGIAMAWRAGCGVANMEFNQFHPTCLYHPQANNFLVTEALRGEGAYLCHADGSRFMQRFDSRLELAPRDIVARAIDFEMKRLGVDCLYLDISYKAHDFIVKHFPTVYNKCLSLGIDITKQPIPVVPAAHYSCGGVITDTSAQTSLNNLYAIGEVAYTGLHGANRMASNSLLECIVFAHAAAEAMIPRLQDPHHKEALPDWQKSQTQEDEDVAIQHNWHELRLFMWDYVGIVRTDKRLERALRRIRLLKQEMQQDYPQSRVSNNLLELRNLITVAELIVRCAMQRKESRGLHYNLDYPERLTEAKPTFLYPENED